MFKNNLKKKHLKNGFGSNLDGSYADYREQGNLNREQGNAHREPMQITLLYYVFLYIQGGVRRGSGGVLRLAQRPGVDWRQAPIS